MLLGRASVRQLAADGLPEPVALASDVQHVAVMQQPVATTVPRAFTRTAPMGMPYSRAPVRASSSAVILYSSMTAPHMSQVQARLRANHPSTLTRILACFSWALV